MDLCSDGHGEVAYDDIGELESALRGDLKLNTVMKLIV